MSTIHCPGGHSFSDGDIPSAHEFTLLADSAIEGLVSAIIAAIREGEDVEARVGYLLLTAGLTTYRCPHCRRLLVFWGGDAQPATAYKLEDQLEQISS